jgi:peptidoglycan/LPS O-acetylase OafA/YrhL
METKSTRLYYIDWLRILAFGLLFVFHSWRPFDHFGWHVKNAEQSGFFDVLTIFIHGWRMDLIFLVSGVGTWFALKSKSSSFFTDRMKRLIVPFIFGVILIIPPQKYIEAISFHGFKGSYFDFLSEWPDIAFSFNFGKSVLLWFGHLGAHIYYLPYLFVMTIPVVFLYKILKNKTSGFDRLKRIIQLPWGVFLPVIPIWLTRFALKPIFPQYTDWTDFFAYMWLFVYGFLLIKEAKFMDVVKDKKWLFLNIGLVLSAVSVFVFINEQGNPEGQSTAYGLESLITSLVTALIEFSWVMFFTALAATKLNFSHKYLQVANQSVLPVYILHQTVIVVFGYFLVGFTMNIAMKFFMLAAVAISFSLLLFLVIRKCDVLRFLFGMKGK